MNETRKQIIELIGDYMDKTLDYGLIIYQESKALIEGWSTSKLQDLTKGYVIIKEDVSGKHWLEYLKQWKGTINNEKEYREIKILGHYDITAVLKYITKSEAIGYGFNGDDINFISIRLINKNINIIYKIPTKPLYLYSEQEEKDLLELLLKLK